MAKAKYPLVVGEEIRKYFHDHTAKHRVRAREVDYWNYKAIIFVEVHGFYKIVKPLHVFKKVYDNDGTRIIANLIIPVGAKVYACHESLYNQQSEWQQGRKMRASEAYVHSLAYERPRKNPTPPASAFSRYDQDFKYIPGEIVKPTRKFSQTPDQCDPGIHFFLNVQDAINWY